MNAPRQRLRARLAAILGTAVLFATAASAQTRPPIPGVTAAEVPEGGATEAIGAAGRKVVEGTRGLLRAIGLGGDDQATIADPFESLKLGAAVAVRSGATARAAQDPAAGTEGKVIELDRRSGVIVVRLADKTTQTLRLLTQRDTSAGAPQETGEVVSVSWIDASGDRIDALFRKTS
jgi:hypothetical protein